MELRNLLLNPDFRFVIEFLLMNYYVTLLLFGVVQYNSSKQLIILLYTVTGYAQPGHSTGFHQPPYHQSSVVKPLRVIAV
jgi:hypothetical protein